MSKPINSSTTSQPFFENLFTKNKKVFFALPIVAVALILTLYFTSDTEKETPQDGSNVDLTLPSAETKELSASKIDDMADFNQMTEDKQKEDSKGAEYDVEGMNPNAVTQTETYQKPDDAVVQKVNKMLGEMDKNQNTYSQAKRAAITKETNSYKEDRVDNSNQKEGVKESFDDFFSSSNRSTSSNSNANVVTKKTDPIIYAVIKGDHLGLRNKQRVTLILPKDITIDGKVFKKNTLIYCQASFSGNRVNFTINYINQISVNLKVYDAEDGDLGLNVRESLVAETSSEVVSDAAYELDVNGVPLAGTLKKVFKRKQQEPRIDLLNNQKLILKNEN